MRRTSCGQDVKVPELRPPTANEPVNSFTVISVPWRSMDGQFDFPRARGREIRKEGANIVESGPALEIPVSAQQKNHKKTKSLKTSLYQVQPSPSLPFKMAIVAVSLSIFCLLVTAVYAGSCTGSSNPPICDPLPDGNSATRASTRVGSLGGVVDDFFQAYRLHDSYSLSNKPSNSMTTAEVIQKYGSIETWDTSRVTNMAYLFAGCDYFNSDISNWIVDRVTSFGHMFTNAISFNINLSPWKVDQVPYLQGVAGRMVAMFDGATSYNQELCGNSWVQLRKSKTDSEWNQFASAMFRVGSLSATSGGHITGYGSNGYPCYPDPCPGEICSCGRGQYLTTTSPKTCMACPNLGPNRQYQDEQGFKGSSCNKTCNADLFLSSDRTACVVYGSAPLPEGNDCAWEGHNGCTRRGYLGGVVDDFFQFYGGNGEISSPIDSMKKVEVIQTYGSIETWDTSRVTIMKRLFKHNGRRNPDIRNWLVDRVVDMNEMFQYATSFNIDLSSWIVDRVTDMDYMFHGATSYEHTLCGYTWIQSTASAQSMSTQGHTRGQIGTEYCNCGIGKYLTTTSPRICADCSIGKYQDEQGFDLSTCIKIGCGFGKHLTETTPQTCRGCSKGKYQDEYGFNGTSCSKECSAGTITAVSNITCTVSGFDPLPDGNGVDWPPSERAGSLCGAVDDYFQDYETRAGNPQPSATRPNNAMTRAEVVQKYGHIEVWDTSRCTNMAYVFIGKKNINPDISMWVVDQAVTMSSMFQNADSFNIDLSSWVVSKVTNVNYMFHGASSYQHELCGNTWLQSTASKLNMFVDTTGAKIGTEICSCSPGLFLTSLKSCNNCTAGRYQNEQGIKQPSCTKQCGVGRYSNEVGLMSKYNCKFCSAGKWSDQLGLVSDEQCTECGAGKYSIAGVGQISNDICTPCSSGRYSEQIGVEACKKW